MPLSVRSGKERRGALAFPSLRHSIKSRLRVCVANLSHSHWLPRGLGNLFISAVQRGEGAQPRSVLRLWLSHVSGDCPLELGHVTDAEINPANTSGSNYRNYLAFLHGCFVTFPPETQLAHCFYLRLFQWVVLPWCNEPTNWDQQWQLSYKILAMSQQIGIKKQSTQAPIILAIIVHCINTKLMLAHQLTMFFICLKINLTSTL